VWLEDLGAELPELIDAVINGIDAFGEAATATWGGPTTINPAETVEQASRFGWDGT
jgi:hypothetical protein